MNKTGDRRRKTGDFAERKARSKGRGSAKIFKPLFFLCLVIGLLFFITSCNQNSSSSTKPTVTCTTGMIADAVRNLADTAIDVVALMGPGVDPHLYKASQGDLKRLQNAELIVYNGWMLEGKLGEVLKKLARQKPVFALAESLPADKLLAPQDFPGQYDPHIWFDLSLWADAVDELAEELKTQFPELADLIEKNRIHYRDELLKKHEWAKTVMSQIPENQKTLVTAHDAFAYFGRAYGIRVEGLQGISTAGEYGLRDVTKMIDLLVENRVPAVFIESSIPAKSMEALVEGCRARGHQLRLGGELYSDALGEAHSPEGTLIGAFEHNVKTITQNLRP